MQQAPNFLLALPVIYVSIAASRDYYARNKLTSSRFPFLVMPDPTTIRAAAAAAAAEDDSSARTDFYDPRWAAFVHLHTITTVVLLTTAHVQIMLRVIALDPVPFWYLAHRRRRDHGPRAWVAYCSWWVPAASVLWALFYPPA